MDKRLALLLDWGLVFVWMFVIFAFSNQPHSGEITSHYFGTFNILIRKAGHVSEHALLFLLIKRALERTMSGAIAIYLTAAVLTILYAASDEYHQSFVPGRTSSLSDVGVDSLGIALAVLLLQAKSYFLAVVKSCKS